MVQPPTATLRSRCRSERRTVGGEGQAAGRLRTSGREGRVAKLRRGAPMSLPRGWPASGAIPRLVDFACRRPRLVVLLTVLLSLVAGAYTAANFAIHTEMTALIPADEPWRTRENALDTAFVQQGDAIMVVIDGRTPE